MAVFSAHRAIVACPAMSREQSSAGKHRLEKVPRLDFEAAHPAIVALAADTAHG